VQREANVELAEPAQRAAGFPPSRAASRRRRRTAATTAHALKIMLAATKKNTDCNRALTVHAVRRASSASRLQGRRLNECDLSNYAARLGSRTRSAVRTRRGGLDAVVSTSIAPLYRAIGEFADAFSIRKMWKLALELVGRRRACGELRRIADVAGLLASSRIAHASGVSPASIMRPAAPTRSARRVFVLPDRRRAARASVRQRWRNRALAHEVAFDDRSVGQLDRVAAHA